MKALTAEEIGTYNKRKDPVLPEEEKNTVGKKGVFNFQNAGQTLRKYR